MKKYLSDIEGLTVEWEWESGGRSRQTFKTQAEMDQAIEENNRLNAEDEDER